MQSTTSHTAPRRTAPFTVTDTRCPTFAAPATPISKLLGVKRLGFRSDLSEKQQLQVVLAVETEARRRRVATSEADLTAVPAEDRRKMLRVLLVELARFRMLRDGPGKEPFRDATPPSSEPTSPTSAGAPSGLTTFLASVFAPTARPTGVSTAALSRQTVADVKEFEGEMMPEVVSPLRKLKCAIAHRNFTEAVGNIGVTWVPRNGGARRVIPTSPVQPKPVAL